MIRCAVLLLLTLVTGLRVARSGELSVPRAEYVIAIVLPRGEQDVEAAFRDYLRKRKFALRFVSIRHSGRPEDLPALHAQIRHLRPDLIYTWGTPMTLALAGRHDSRPGPYEIRDIPILFTQVTDPVGSGLVASLDRPGGNVTGVIHVAPMVVQWNAMNAYHQVRRVGYVTNPAELNTRLVRAALGKLADAQGFTVIDEVVPLDRSGQPDVTQLPEVVRRIAARQVDFLYIPSSNFLARDHGALLTRTALAEKIPTFCATESIVRDADCLFGLYSSDLNIGRLAAYKAAQILLEKTPPGKIPAETLQSFSLLVNLRVASSLGRYPPLTLLGIADVIPVTASAAPPVLPVKATPASLSLTSGSRP